MAKITYDNKSYINQNANIPNVNKVTDTDMNEIKSVVNQNYDEETENSFFKVGDTFTIDDINGGLYVGGTLTNSQKTLIWSITLPKSLKNITSVTVSDYKLTVRHVGGGYIYNEVSSVDGTFDVNIVNDYIITFQNIRTTSVSATNNTPIAIGISCTLTFN